MYYQPAMNYCQNEGINLNLSKAVIYDTIIQHGEGTDPDSLNAIIKNTNKRMNGNPKSSIYEHKWLKAFIEERKKMLQHANNPETRKVWSESTGRCDAFMYILNSGNFNLSIPIKLNTKDYKIEIR